MFFWPVVHIGNHGDQISNSPDELLVTNQTKGHVPGGGGGERVPPTEQSAFLKVKKTCLHCLNVRIVRGFTCLVSTCELFLATS